MSMAVISAAVAIHVDRGGSLRNGDSRVTAGRRVINVAGKCPVRRSSRHVSEAGAEDQQIAQVLTQNASGSAVSAVGLAIVSAAVAIHVDRGGSLRNGDGRVTAGRRVINVAGK